MRALSSFERARTPAIVAAAIVLAFGIALALWPAGNPDSQRAAGGSAPAPAVGLPVVQPGAPHVNLAQPPELVPSSDASLAHLLAEVADALKSGADADAARLVAALRHLPDLEPQALDVAFDSDGRARAESFAEGTFATGLCLVIGDHTRLRLIQSVMNQWNKETLDEVSAANWAKVSGQPLETPAYKALEDGSMRVLNGLWQAASFRWRVMDRADAAKREFDNDFELITGPALLPDPALSMLLHHLAGALRRDPRCAPLAHGYAARIRDSDAYSLRLRMQASLMLGGPSASVSELLAAISASLGQSDCARAISDYIKQGAPMSKDDWRLILAAVVSARGLSEGAFVFMHAFLGAQETIFSSDMSASLGMSLIELFAESREGNRGTSLAGTAFLQLTVARSMFVRRGARGKPGKSWLPPLSDPGQAEQLLKELLATLEGEWSPQGPGVGSRGVHLTNLVRMLYELGLELPRVYEAVGLVLAAAGPESDKLSVCVCACGRTASVPDATLRACSVESVAFVLRIIDTAVSCAPSRDGPLSEISYCKALAGGAAAVLRATGYPALTEAQGDVLRRLKERFDAQGGNPGAAWLARDFNQSMAEIQENYNFSWLEPK